MMLGTQMGPWVPGSALISCRSLVAALFSTMPAVAGKGAPISLGLQPGLTVELALTWRMVKAVPASNSGVKGRLLLLLSQSSEP